MSGPKRSWLVTAEVKVSLSTVVRARTAKQACELAAERRIQSLAGNPGDPETEWVHSGEIDGEPFDLVAEAD